MKKRILSALIALSMIFSIIPVMPVVYATAPDRVSDAENYYGSCYESMVNSTKGTVIENTDSLAALPVSKVLLEYNESGIITKITVTGNPDSSSAAYDNGGQLDGFGILIMGDYKVEEVEDAAAAIGAAGLNIGNVYGGDAENFSEEPKVPFVYIKYKNLALRGADDTALSLVFTYVGDTEGSEYELSDVLDSNGVSVLDGKTALEYMWGNELSERSAPDSEYKYIKTNGTFASSNVSEDTAKGDEIPISILTAASDIVTGLLYHTTMLADTDSPEDNEEADFPPIKPSDETKYPTELTYTLGAPTVGAVLSSTNPNVTADDGAVTKTVTWTDGDNTELDGSSDKFIPGKTYNVEIAASEGKNTSFDNLTDADVTGINSAWGTPTVSDNKTSVTASYTVPKVKITAAGITMDASDISLGDSFPTAKVTSNSVETDSDTSPYNTDTLGISQDKTGASTETGSQEITVTLTPSDTDIYEFDVTNFTISNWTKVSVTKTEAKFKKSITVNSNVTSVNAITINGLSTPSVGGTPVFSTDTLSVASHSTWTVSKGNMTGSLTSGSKYDAVTEYGYPLTVTIPADENYEFADGNGAITATVNGVEYTCTRTDAKTLGLTPKATTGKLKVTNIDLGGTLTKSAYDPNSSTASDKTLNVAGLTATLTYNNGETQLISDLTTSSNYGVYAIAAADDTAAKAKSSGTVENGGTLTVSSPTDIYVVYDPANDTVSISNPSTNLDTTGGKLADGTATITLGSEISSVAVTVATPAPGGTPVTDPDDVGTDATANEYSVDSITWTDSSGTNLGASDKFVYGKTYTATIVLGSDTTNKYAFSSGATSTLNNDSISNTLSSSNTVMTITKEYTMPNIPKITSILDYDYYDGGNDVVITLDSTPLGIESLVINNGTDQTISSTDYTLDTTAKTITIPKAKIKTLVETKKNSGNTLTAPFTAESWTVALELTGMESGTTISADDTAFDVSNTTPYLAISASTGGTIKVEQGGSTLYDKATAETIALKKTDAVTVTATANTDYAFSAWTGNAVSGSTNPDSSLAPASATSYTLGATFNSPHYLTVTATNGTVNSVSVAGSTATAIASGSNAGKYVIHDDDTVVVTVTPNTDYKFDGTTPWTSAAGGTDAAGTGKARTYTFTATDADASVTANLVEDYTILTISADSNGTVTVVDKDNTAATSAGTTGTYKIFASKGPYTVKATANSAYKLTALTDTTATLPLQEATTSVSYSDGDKTVTATFTAKTAPAWDSTTTAANATHQISMGSTDFTYKHTATSDYTLSSALVDGNSVGTLSGDTLTIDTTALNGLSAGSHTVTFTFTDNLASSDTTKNVTLTRSFTITAAPTVDSVTLPTGKKHGDNVGTFAFTINNAGTKTTYTYTDGTGWDKTVPSGVTVSVQNGTSSPKATDMALDTFISTYVTGKIVRYNQKYGGTDDTLRNNDTVTVTLGSNSVSAKLTVAQKPITITITGNNSFVKDYDGDAIVDDTLTLSTTDSKVSTDDVDFTDNTQIGATGKYYATGTNNEAKNAIVGFTHDVKFTKNLDTTNHKDLENYDITLSDTTGSISKLPITVPASIFEPIAQAAYNASKSDTNQTKSGVKNDVITSDQKLIDADNTDGITITYDYAYDDLTGTDVSITNPTATNYAITVTGKATGSRAARAVSSVVVTPLNGSAESSTYYSSDTPDAKIVINYSDGEKDTYANIAAAKAGNIDSVKWGTAATTAGSDDVSTSTNLLVADSGKYIVATVKSAVGSGNTVGGAQITVNKIPVTVTVSADKISKTYDGDATFTSGTDTVEPTTGFTYALSVDKTSTGLNNTSNTAYDTVLTNSSITGTGATVAFKQADVYHKTYDGATVTYDDVATATNGTISDDTEYTVTNTVSNIKEAEISKLKITVTDITDILPVKQNSTGVISSKLAATNRKESDQSKTGYEATATVPELVGSDYVLFDISYEYADTANPSGTTNGDKVNIRSIALATAASTNKNGNYELNTSPDYTTADGLKTISGHGTVTARTLNSITLALPTKLASGVTYGDSHYQFTSDADYAGMKVTLQYNDGNVEYTWAQDSSDSKYKWHVVEASEDKYIADADKPFTLQWSGADLSAAEAVNPTSAILWTYNKNGRVMTAAMNSKSDTKTVTVNQKEITVAAVYNNGTSDTTPEKNYDGGQAIKPAGTWSFSTTGAVTGDTISAVALTGDVTYSAAAASTTAVPLLFNGKAYNASDINGQFTLTVDGDDTAKSKAGSYKVTEVTGTTTGTINKRPVTLTQIKNITSVAQYSNSVVSSETTAYNNPTNSTDITATYAAAGGDDTAGTGTGVVGSETVNVKFKYEYKDTNTAETITDNTGTRLALSDVSISNTNYDLTATLPGVEAVGKVTAATVTEIKITSPKIFGKTADEVQYNDIFTYDGLEVKVVSGDVTETYTPKTYNNGNITEWTKASSRGVADTTVAANAIPFDLSWNNANPVITQGANLTTVYAATDGVTLKAKLNSKATINTSTVDNVVTDKSLVVGPRKVTPAASITASTAKVTKVYDSTTTYNTTAGTGYNTSTGDIEIALTGAVTSYTADANKDTSGNYVLPTALSTTATYAYNSANVAEANKINITGMALSGTLTGGDALTNYVLTKNSDDVDAEITKADIIVTNVRYIDSIVQGSAISAGSADITTDNTKKPYAELDASTPAAGSDVLDLTIGYTYTSSSVASAKDGSGNYLDDIDVTISSVTAKAGSATASNYNVYADMADNTNHTGDVKTTGHGTVTPEAVTLTVTNPTQLDANYTFGTPLNVDGLTVNVKYGTTGSGTDYIAKVSGDPATVKWHKGTATGDEVAVDDLPFTYQWTDLKNGGTGTTLTNGSQLPPKHYNSAAILATLKEKDSTDAYPTGKGAAITVNKKEISTINATLGASDTISKTYNRTLALKTEDAAKLSYAVPTTEFVDGYSKIFSVTATPEYDEKDVKDGIGISFKDAGFASGANSDNYEFASTVNVKEFVGETETPITGNITKATITIQDVYIPSTTASASQLGTKTESVSNVKASTSASSTTIQATGVVSADSVNEADYINFSYDIVYKEADVKDTEGRTNVFVTLANNTQVLTSDAGDKDVLLTNYEVVWTSVTNRSTASGNETDKDYATKYPSDDSHKGDYLLGNVSGDKFTDLSITPPTALKTHTHGDALDLSGLTVTAKSENNTAGTTYSIIGAAGSQTWSTDGSTAATLPVGLTVKLGDLDITTNAALAELQAHYTNMNGKTITANATPADSTLSRSTDAMEVAKAALTATPSKTTGIDKYYDSTDKLVESITYTLSDTKTFIKTSYTDVVTVSDKTDPKYNSANVYMFGSPAVPSPQAITFDLELGGADAANYTVAISGTVTGTIKPRTVKVSDFGANIKATDAVYKDTTDANAKGTISNVAGDVGGGDNVYTYDWLASEAPSTGNLPSTLKAPNINITYDYGTLVNTLNDSTQIPYAVAGTATGSFQAEFATATDNFILDYSDVTYLPGAVKAAGIVKIEIEKGNKEYTYGDALTGKELDDVIIKLYDSAADGAAPIENFHYSSRGSSDATVLASELTAYGLELVLQNNSTDYDQANDILKSGTATVQVKESKTGGKESNVVDLTVAKRKLLIVQDGSADKTYDGSAAVDPDTMTLKVADATAQAAKNDGTTETRFGLATVDATAVTNAGKTLETSATVTTKPTTMKYKDGSNDAKDASTGYSITASDDTAITSSEFDVNEYELVLDDLKGDIKAKTVKLTPVIDQKVYTDDSDISLDGGLNKTGVSNSMTVDATDGFVSGEDTKYVVEYSVKLSATKHNADGTYAISKAAADASGITSGTVADGADTYAWSISTTDPLNNPLSNYNFVLNDASVKVDNKQATKAEIVETDSKKIRTSYNSGDAIDFKNLVVKVTYNSGVPQTFEYGTASWDNSFKIVKTDKTTEVKDGDKLTTADSGDRYYVIVNSSITTQNTTSQITVNAKEIEVTAVQSSTTSRTYDATADADVFVKYKFLNPDDVPAGLTLSATNTAKADFIEKPASGSDAAIPPSYVGEDKPIKITADASSFTLEGTNAGEYTVKWQDNTKLVGTVEKLPLYIESWPLLTAGRNITATEPATISYGGNVLIGDTDSNAVLDTASKAKITTTALQADLDKFNATFSADYTAQQLKTATTEPYDLTFTTGTPVITATGDDADLFAKNYTLTYADPKGIVVPSAIRITNVSTPEDSTHGDENVNLEGIKFTVHYTADDAGNSAVYTFRNTGDKWYVGAGENLDNSAITTEITKAQLLNNYGVQLRWNAKNSSTLEPDKVLGKANHEDDQKQIVIMVPLQDLTGTDEFAMAKTGNVNIKQRQIWAYVKKTDASGNKVQLNKPYDGNALADPSGVTFDFYVPDSDTPTTYDKYTNWFAGEAVKIDTPAAGVQATGTQLKAVYVGGTASENDANGVYLGSYKNNGTAWEKCDIAGKDVKRDSTGAIIAKPVQLSNLHLTGDGSDNYILVNRDTWQLAAVETGFEQYEPTASESEGNTKLSNRLEGIISPIDAKVTVTTAPPISKNTPDSELKREVVNGTSGAYTVSGLVSGDSLSNINVYVTYPNKEPNQQNLEVTVENKESGYVELNYTITPDPQFVVGSIMDTGITDIEILEQPKLTYEHGDTLNLKDSENPTGMKIKVTYTDGTIKVWTYGGTGTSNAYPWLLESYSSAAGYGNNDVAESDAVADLQDIALTWNSTNNAVSPTDIMSCNDENKGYEGNNPKKTRITVSALLPEDPDAATYTYVTPKNTKDITVSKKQLGIQITGYAEKVYDSNNSLKDANLTVSGKTPFTVTITGGEAGGVSFDTAAAIEAGDLTFVSTDSKPNSYAGDKTIAIANLASYLTGDYSTDAYDLPTSTVIAANNDATGAITPRPITITATTLPTLDLNTATPDSGTEHEYTLDLAKTTNFTVTGPAGGTGIFQSSDGTLTADEALVVWKVTYDTSTIDEDSATTAPIKSFSTGSLITGETAEDKTNVAANYDPTFVHTQTDGPVTPLVQANGIKVNEPPTKSSYDHGAKLDLSGMVVTVTKPGATAGTTEDTNYTYDPTTGGWKLDDDTTVAAADAPFDLYWAEENDTDDSKFVDGNKVPLAADGYEFDITDLPNGFTGTNGYITAALKSDKKFNDATPITVSKLQLYMHLTGSATKVYDKDAKLKKIADDAANTYDLKVVFTTSEDAPAAGDTTIGTLATGQIDTWVTGGVIKYADKRDNTPDEYVGTSADGEKTLAVVAGSLGNDYLTLTEDEAKIYTLPTEAGQIKIDEITASITARPITLYTDLYNTLTLTEEILAKTEHEVALAEGTIGVYDGTFAAADIDTDTAKWTLDAGIDWKVTYDIDGINLNTTPLVADVDWGKANNTVNAAPHTLTGAAAANYTVTWLAPDTGAVRREGDPEIIIVTPPTAEKTDDKYIYGTPTDWTDFEYKVVTPEGTTSHRWDAENGDWFVGTDPATGTEYTAPENGTTFKWNDGEPSEDLPTTEKIDIGPNKVTISVPTDTTPITKSSDPMTGEKKELTIKVSGQHSKPYDGKTTLEDPNNEITLTLEGAIDGDDVTFETDPTVSYADKNVSYYKDSDNKPLTITGGTLSEEMAKKYTIKAEYTLADDADIKIVPQDIKVLITAPAIMTNITESAKTLTDATATYARATTKTENIFKLTDGTIADVDTVAIKYSGSYVDITAGDKTTADKAEQTDKDAVFKFTAAPVVDGELADNYNIAAYDIEYTVTQYTAPSTPGRSGGGGGGGSVNTLNIHYENEDGTAGDEVSKISVPLGTDPTDLIGVIKTKIKDMTVLWTSDNEKVATVDENGVVTYVGEGTATITAQSKQTKSLKDTVVVTVTAAEATPAPTDKPEPTTAPRTHERVNDSLITKTMLNPYIVGYDDYVFGPELPISREELAAIFARLIANNLYMDKNYDTSFPDVPEKWSKSYIGYLEGFNVVTGYEDGNFRPENNITRAEMAVMMAKAEGYDITPDIDASEAGFPDVDAGYATWSAAKAIQILSDLGIMSGYEDGTFRPGQPITRAETVATVNRVLAAQEVANREVLPSDVTDAHWAYEDIVFAMNHRVLKDAAADPHSFIWSEEFDKNMVTNTEKVQGETEVIEGEETSEAETSDDTAGDETAAEADSETKEEAETPTSTDKPTI